MSVEGGKKQETGGDAGRKLEAKGAKIGEIQKIGPKTTPGSQRTAAQERAKAKATAAINKLFAGLGKKEDIVAKISGTKTERDAAFKKAFEGAVVSTGQEGEGRKTLAMKDSGPNFAEPASDRKAEAKKKAGEAIKQLIGATPPADLLGGFASVEPDWSEQKIQQPNIYQPLERKGGEEPPQVAKTENPPKTPDQT